MRSLYLSFFLASALYSTASAQVANVYLDLGIKKFVGKESTLKRQKYFSIQTDASDTDFISSNTLFSSRPEIKPAFVSVLSPIKGTYKKNITNHPFLFKIQGLDINSNPNTSELEKEITNYFKPLSNSGKTLLSLHDASKNNIDASNVFSAALFFKNIGSKIDASKPSILLNSPLLNTRKLSNDDFKIFQSLLKPFIDLAGKEIDQYTLDITDGVDIETQSIAYRSGANIEATLDLINTYNFSKYNKVKPVFIESYGLKFDNWLTQKHSNSNDALMIESLNNQVMSLLDKPDNIIMALPNIFANTNAAPNPYTIFTKGADNSNTKTDLIKFYDFWKDVAGDRTYITSDNPDVQVNAFKNGGKWINIFNNLSDKTQTLNLKFSEYDADRISKYTLRHIYTNAEGFAEITEAHTDLHIDQLDIEPFETFMLILDIPTDAIFATSIVEYNNYSKSYLKPIEANEPINFEINNVVTGKGRANIRLSFGRDRKLSRYPIVKLNDNVVLTPENWAGYDQVNREQFFGTLVIPVPLSYVAATNKINITFPDKGGYVSSVAINTEIFSKDVENKNYVEKNASVFVSHGGILLNVSNKLECVNPRIIDEKGNIVKKIKDYHRGSTVDISTLKTGSYTFKLKNGAEYPFKK